MTAQSAARSAIAILQSTALPALVQDEVVRMLRSGELGAGDKLNEVALATRLGVSRGAVREAFRALEESGLVRSEKNRGVFVREISPIEAAELYALRAGLDEPDPRVHRRAHPRAAEVLLSSSFHGVAPRAIRTTRCAWRSVSATNSARCSTAST